MIIIFVVIFIRSDLNSHMCFYLTLLSVKIYTLLLCKYHSMMMMVTIIIINIIIIFIIIIVLFIILIVVVITIIIIIVGSCIKLD